MNLVCLSSCYIPELRLSSDLIVLHHNQLLLQLQILSHLLAIRQEILIVILRYIPRLRRPCMYKWHKETHLQHIDKLFTESFLEHKRIILVMNFNNLLLMLHNEK